MKKTSKQKMWSSDKMSDQGKVGSFHWNLHEFGFYSFKNGSKPTKVFLKG